MHLVDTTLFYSPTSGGVKRYLNAKHAWLTANTSWQHTLLVPGDATHIAPGDVSTVRGMLLPGTFNYRMPLGTATWKSALAALRPDLIEVGDVFHPAWAAVHVAQGRIPLVAFFHSNLPGLLGRRLGSPGERTVWRYVRWMYERFDLVLAPSRVMCDYLRRMGVERAAYQPLGVDPDIFAPERRKLDLRKRLDLPEDTRLLAYAGRFSGEKNLTALREAFALLGPKYHLLLIGGGRSARPEPNVTMVPYRRDSLELAQWLASTDALVHAGTSETFGLVILEAMACARPVVGVRAGAVPELVDEQVGMLASDATPAVLARAISGLYDRDIEALGRAARERVLKRFSWSQALQHQMGTYAGLVGSARLQVTARGVLELDSPS